VTNNGSEEIETMTIFDTLKRAKTIQLTFAKVKGKVGAKHLGEASDLKNDLAISLMQGLKFVMINLLTMVRSLIQTWRAA
jgi:hypothetical protein